MTELPMLNTLPKIKLLSYGTDVNEVPAYPDLDVLDEDSVSVYDWLREAHLPLS